MIAQYGQEKTASDYAFRAMRERAHALNVHGTCDGWQHLATMHARTACAYEIAASEAR